jgi:hypothetical protein
MARSHFMFTNDHLVDRIEDAYRLAPYCDQCGGPTVIVERDDALWLECSSLTHRQGGIREFIALGFASLHLRREIATLREAA